MFRRGRRRLRARHARAGTWRLRAAACDREIVRLVASGYKNKEVGSTLSISERTVKTHLTNIFQKLGVRDRVGLVMYALKHGLTGTAVS